MGPNWELSEFVAFLMATIGTFEFLMILGDMVIGRDGLSQHFDKLVRRLSTWNTSRRTFAIKPFEQLLKQS